MINFNLNKVLEMKALTTILLVTVSFYATAQVGIADRGQRTFNLNEQKIHSNSDVIKVNSKGDTVLVSSFQSNNLNQQVRTEIEKINLGTPFFKNGWYKGNLTFQGSEPVTGTMAYNLVDGKPYFSISPNTPAVATNPKTFEIEGTRFYNFGNEYLNASDSYYEVVNDGEPVLLKEHLARYVKHSVDQQNGYDVSRPEEYAGEFQKFNKYYFVIQKNMVLVKNNRAFFKDLGPYASKAKEISSAKKLDLRKESDIRILAENLALPVN